MYVLYIFICVNIDAHTWLYTVNNIYINITIYSICNILKYFYIMNINITHKLKYIYIMYKYTFHSYFLNTIKHFFVKKNTSKI